MRARFLVLVVVLGAAPARAQQSETLPAGKFGFVAGVRRNLGALGERYAWGLLLGIEAHYHPTPIGQTWSLGITWATRFGRAGAGDPDIVENPLRLLEMSAGVRARLSLSDSADRFLVVGGGGAVLRSNVPVPPDDKRLYGGGYGMVGFEEFVLGRNLLSLEARYDAMVEGPQSVTVAVGLGFGNGASNQISLITTAAFIIGALVMQSI